LKDKFELLVPKGGYRYGAAYFGHHLRACVALHNVARFGDYLEPTLSERNVLTEINDRLAGLDDEAYEQLESYIPLGEAYVLTKGAGFDLIQKLWMANKLPAEEPAQPDPSTTSTRPRS